MLILASTSPQRQRLLHELGLEFTIQPSHFDELSVIIHHYHSPAAYTEAIAAGKILAVAESQHTQLPPEAVIIGGDLVAFVNEQPLGKPDSRYAAAQMMQLLLGTTHTEICAVGVWSAPRGLTMQHSMATVTLPLLSDAELEQYLDQADPLNKCAGFSLVQMQKILQARPQPAAVQIDGDVTTIIGLPVPRTAQLLQSYGVRVPQDATLLEKQWRQSVFADHL